MSEFDLQTKFLHTLARGHPGIDAALADLRRDLRRSRKPDLPFCVINHFSKAEVERRLKEAKVPDAGDVAEGLTQTAGLWVFGILSLAKATARELQKINGVTEAAAASFLSSKSGEAR